MPVSVVVGGQYGSEGKGKVALHVATTTRAAAVVRVGGPNSGHTGYDSNGRAWILRQMPASCLARDTLVLLPAGSLIDPNILQDEITRLGFDTRRVHIDASASVVSDHHKKSESEGNLGATIGSTNSGTGAALIDRIRRGKHLLAHQHPYLRQFVHPFLPEMMRHILDQGRRIVVEGTQGFGLSLWHGGHYPFATSRDTTAASFVAEAGLSPRDVDDVVVTIRTFPIRVGGNSGPLENEIDWPTLAQEANLPPDHVELTSATRKIRRVARFHPDVVRRAILVNRPTRIALNHLDYVDRECGGGIIGQKGASFVHSVERMIDRQIDLVGVSPSEMTGPRGKIAVRA